MTNQQPVFNPVTVLSSAGAARSSAHKLGDGPWFCNVTDDLGIDWDVEQLATSWRAVSSTGLVLTAPTLEKLAVKLLSRPAKKE